MAATLTKDTLKKQISLKENWLEVMRLYINSLDEKHVHVIDDVEDLEMPLDKDFTVHI